MKIAKHCIVTGRVQGVYFRQGTCDEAQKLGVTGWVRNLPTGEVECLICGEVAAVAKMCEWLKKGPAAAKVEELKIGVREWEEFGEFRILR